MSENKFTTIKERVIQIADYKEIAKEKFFGEIGMTSANFRGEARKTPLNSNAIENILSKHSDINPTWLLTGEGDMLLDFTKGITGGEKPEVDREFNKINEEVTLLRKLINANTDVKEISDTFEDYASGLLVINGIVQQYSMLNKLQDVLTHYSDNKVKIQEVKTELRANLGKIKELIAILEPYESSILEMFEKLIDFDKRHDQEYSLDE